MLIKATGFGGVFAQRAVILLATASLAGCLEEDAEQRELALSPPAQTADPAESPVNDNNVPEISGTPPASAEAGAMYSFTPAASDADGDFLEFSAVNLPGWAQLSAETGALTGVPGDAHVGDTGEMTINVTDGRDTRSIGPFVINVKPRNQTPPPSNTAPTISGTPSGAVTVGEPYSFQPSAADVNGDTLRFSISNRPSWTAFNSSTGRLTGTPAAANIGVYSNIVISVNDGHATSALPAFAIQVRGPDNRAPAISGSPATSVQATQWYTFQPAASDPDNDALTYSIANRPAWASFSTSTGRLSGAPTATHVGVYSNIVVSVSDGRASASLPAFAINVAAAPNGAPSIGGSPPPSVNTGAVYSFTPSASDPDGDALGFSIQNRPSWASFDTASGRLSGAPTSAHVGAYDNIVISVSDGQASASLAAFSITVAQQATSGSASLSWTPPVQNTDGSSITDLAGFRIVYGTAASALNQTIDIANPGATTYTVSGLGSGVWHFAVKAYNAAGAESAPSNTTSKTIP